MKRPPINPTPPLGLAYISGALEEAGHKVTAIDAIGQNPRQHNHLEFTPHLNYDYGKTELRTNGISNKEIIERIPADTQVIGLSCMFSNNWLADRHLIKVIRDAFPDAIFIAGGESITAKPELWMTQAPELDICVLGEGEETIVELLSALESKNEMNEIAGIVFRHEYNRELIHTPRRTRIKDIDQLNRPAWSLFPLDNYHKYKVQFSSTNRKTFPVLATRGCPYSCTFCSSPQMWGTRYYMRETRCVIDEIEFLVKNYGASNIDLFDLTAIVKKDWIIRFAKELLERQVKITWSMPGGTRSEVIDEEVIYYLKLSGCRSITYAPESGSPRMLKMIKKKVSLPNMMESMKAAYQSGIPVEINMILALPGETHRDVLQTLWFLVRCGWAGVNEMGLAMFHPYPGSVLFEQLLKEKKIDLTTDDFFFHTVTTSPLEHSSRHNYNDNISARWYRFYNLAAHALFFSVNFLMRPARFFAFAKNVISNNPESRFQRTITRLFYREKHDFSSSVN